MAIRRRQVQDRIWQLSIAVGFVIAWETAVRSEPSLAFFFGRPSKIAGYLFAKSADGSLLRDTIATLIEIATGFIVGNAIGAAIGLTLWYSQRMFRIARPFILALGAAPVFALAPVLIVWFGTGLFSKVMVVAFSTVFIALLQAYTGAEEISKDHLRLMKSLRATKLQTFRKVVAPSVLVWVVAAFRLNIGFAILGAFVGEYISSTEGLGHLILVASGLFDISLVLTGVFVLSIIAVTLNAGIEHMQTPLRRIIVLYF